MVLLLRSLLLCRSVVAKQCLTLCDPMDWNTPGLPVSHCLPEFAQVHIHCVGDAIQPSHPLPPSSPFAFNVSQHQGLFQWVSCLHQVAKVLEYLRSLAQVNALIYLRSLPLQSCWQLSIIAPLLHSTLTLGVGSPRTTLPRVLYFLYFHWSSPRRGVPLRSGMRERQMCFELLLWLWKHLFASYVKAVMLPLKISQWLRSTLPEIFLPWYWRPLGLSVVVSQGPVSSWFSKGWKQRWELAFTLLPLPLTFCAWASAFLTKASLNSPVNHSTVSLFILLTCSLWDLA